MTLQTDQLRLAMRLWATGVTVVTARFGNERRGLTVSSFTSVSIDPPLVLVSIANASGTGELIRQSRHFGVTILAEGQDALSNIFAGRVPESADRFADLETGVLTSGAPFLSGGLVWLDCRVKTAIPAGMSTVYLAEVIDEKHTEGGQPLLYFHRAYQEMCS